MYKSVMPENETTEFQSRSVLVALQLGDLFQETGRLEDAHVEYLESLRIARQLFPRDRYPRGHPLLCSIMQNFATHCWLIGETELAASLYREVVRTNCFTPATSILTGTSISNARTLHGRASS